MNTVNFNDKGALTDSTLVGVDNNQLVVTVRPQDFGTFAVTTANAYTAIPYAKARNFRINNFTGKIVGVRRRHKKIIIDRFEDTDFPGWSGSGLIASGQSLEGARGANITGLKYIPLTTEVMNDNSEVEVTFLTPNASNYSTKINVWDNANRIGNGNSAAKLELTQANSSPNTEYRVIFRLRKSVGKYDTFLEDIDGRSAISSDVAGEFGTNNMKDSVLSFETDERITVDPIIYQQKVNFTHELMLDGSTLGYPCEDNISEYEVINLGSDRLGYSDNTQNIHLSGFYSS